MALTTERAEKLAAYLKADESRKALLDLSAEDATAKINADGNDFTVDELKEFCEGVKQAIAQADGSELDAASLEDVSGGSITFAAACAGFGLAMGGYKLGKDIAQRWGW